jgi:hypothetical protein
MICRVLPVAVVLLCACFAPAQAQNISEVDALNFGTFGLQDNDTVAAITITPDNDTFADPQFVVSQQGQRGHYELTGFPADVTFYIGVDVPNPPSEGGIVLANQTDAANGGGPVFVLDSLSIANGGVMQTDGAGDATLYIGGTLRTSGAGTAYDGGNYLGTYTITIHY